MGELKILIWIILGIIYIISRVRKKTAADAVPKPTDDYREDKPVTFEELLKEIQAAKAPKETPKPVFDSPVNYDDNVKEEAESLEKTDYSYRNQDSIYETYEKAKQEAFHRPSMEETLKLENTIVRFGQFKGYEHQEVPSFALQYGKDLQNPANFKKAFILSEILSRRF